MRSQKSKYRPFKKPRFYLDENFPPQCIGVLSKFNIKHAVLDYKFVHREDKFHYNFSREDKRILVTLDHDYENDRSFRLNETFGVIIISVPSPITPEKINEVLFKLKKLINTMSFDDLKGSKIFATQAGWTHWYIEQGRKFKESHYW